MNGDLYLQGIRTPEPEAIAPSTEELSEPVVEHKVHDIDAPIVPDKTAVKEAAVLEESLPEDKSHEAEPLSEPVVEHKLHDVDAPIVPDETAVKIATALEEATPEVETTKVQASEEAQAQAAKEEEEQKRIQEEKIAAAKLEQDKLAEQKLEQEKLEQEKLAALKLEEEKAAAKAEEERLAVSLIPLPDHDYTWEVLYKDGEDVFGVSLAILGFISDSGDTRLILVPEFLLQICVHVILTRSTGSQAGRGKTSCCEARGGTGCCRQARRR